MNDEGSSDVEFVWRKWDGTTHWRYQAIFLGGDEYGEWFGQLAGTRQFRPGVDTVAPTDSVLLVPASGGWVATFYASRQPDEIMIYVDIASQVEWDRPAGIVTAIDMDLDVIKTDDERATWIDDEDEFAERIISMAYPQPEIDAAERNAAEVAAAVRSSIAPFDGRHEQWLRALASLV